MEATAAERTAALARLESTAAEREAELKRTLAEREAEVAASDEAARVLAQEAGTASMALFSVSQSILRWREELVVASLEPESFGAPPTAQQVLDVVADMENEIEVRRCSMASSCARACVLTRHCWLAGECGHG